MPMAQGFQPRSPRIHRRPSLKKHPHLGTGMAEMPMPSASETQERQHAQHNYDHAHDSASLRAKPPIMGNGSRKKPLFPRLESGPMPMMESPRGPDSAPLTLGSEISQEIARLSAEELHFDQRKITPLPAPPSAPRPPASCGAYRGPRCGRSGGRGAWWCGCPTSPGRAASTDANRRTRAASRAR